MDREIVETEYSLRFVGIDLDTIKKFNKIFPDINFETRPYFKDKRKHGLVFVLDDSLDLKKIGAFISECKVFERFDLFMEIDSDTDNYIVEIPMFVLSAIRDLPIRVNISFMYNQE